MKGKALLIIAILTLLTAAIWLSVKNVEQSAIIGGFTVSSISAVNVHYNDEGVPQGEYFVTVLANGNSQQIEGTVTPGIFKEWGFDVEKGFSISTTAREEKLSYPIVRAYEKPIYTYLLQEVSRPSLTVAPVCPNPVRTVHEMTEYAFGVKTKKWCVERYEAGYTGQLDNPDISYSADLTVNIAGETARTVTIGSGGTAQQSRSLGPLGSVQWTGSLLTGNRVKNPNLYRAIYFPSFKEWRIVRSDDWNTYNSLQISAQDDLNEPLFEDGYLESGSTLDKFVWAVGSDAAHSDITIRNAFGDIIDDVNNQANSLVDRAETIVPGQDTLGTSTGGTLTIPSSTKFVTNPQLTFRIKAETIGVRIFYGEPKITSASCPKFESGSNGIPGESDGYVTVKVKNDGDFTSTVAVSILDCDFRVLQQDNKQQIAPGITKTFSIPIDADGRNDLRDSCRIVAYDVNEPSQSDDTNVVCEATAPTGFCGPGKEDSQYIFGSCVNGCVDGEVSQLFCCETPITLNQNTGKYQCAESTTTGGDECTVLGQKSPRFFCENGIGTVEIIALFGALIMMFVIAVGVRNSKYKVSPVQMLALSVFGGLLFGVLIYYYWWVAMLGGIAYIGIMYLTRKVR